MRFFGNEITVEFMSTFSPLLVLTVQIADVTRKNHVSTGNEHGFRRVCVCDKGGKNRALRNVLHVLSDDDDASAKREDARW